MMMMMMMIQAAREFVEGFCEKHGFSTPLEKCGEIR